MARIGGKAQKLTAAVADAIFNLVYEVPPQTIDDNLHRWATELYGCENKPLHCPFCFTSNSKTALPKFPAHKLCLQNHFKNNDNNNNKQETIFIPYHMIIV